MNIVIENHSLCFRGCWCVCERSECSITSESLLLDSVCVVYVDFNYINQILQAYRWL